MSPQEEADDIAAVSNMICEIRTLALPIRRMWTRALHALFNRIAGSWNSIGVLVDTDDVKELEARANDCATILRCMYDAYLQAGYIATNPEALGKLYLDYEHVERYRAQKAVVGQNNRLAGIVKSSRLRPDGERRLQESYDRVKDAYANSAGKIRNRWYKKKGVEDLAKAVDKRDEYVWLLKRHNSSVHSGPFATLHGPSTQDAEVIKTIAMMIVIWTARIVVDNDGLQVSDVTKALVRDTPSDFLSM